MEDEARELQLFIENDGELYRQQYQPILKNLANKKAKGIYNHEKAVKLFMYLVDNGARKYNKEFDTGRFEINIMVFPKNVRLIVAENLTRDFEVEYNLGNYDEFLYKKYKSKTGNTTIVRRHLRRNPKSPGVTSVVKHERRI